jgi:hypothetical protein
MPVNSVQIYIKRPAVVANDQKTSPAVHEQHVMTGSNPSDKITSDRYTGRAYALDQNAEGPWDCWSMIL